MNVTLLNRNQIKSFFQIFGTLMVLWDFRPFSGFKFNFQESLKTRIQSNDFVKEMSFYLAEVY